MKRLAKKVYNQDPFVQLSASIKSGFASVYVFADGSARGNEEADSNSRESLKNEALDILKAAFLGADEEGLGVSSHEGKEARPADIFDEAMTDSLFGERKIILVRSAEPFLRDSGELLLKYLTSASGNTVLVLIVKSLDGRTAVAKELAKKAAVLKFDPLRGAAVKRWIKDRAEKKYERQISPEAVDTLADAIGGNVGLIDRELEKLTAYIGDRSKINVTDVLALTPAGRLHSIFELTDAVGGRDRKRALAIAHHLFYEGVVLPQMLTLIADQFKKLHEAFMFESEGVSPMSIPEQLKIYHPYAQEKFLAQMKLFASDKKKISPLSKIKTIEDKYEILTNADLDMKLSKKPDLQILEELIIKLCN